MMQNSELITRRGNSYNNRSHNRIKTKGIMKVNKLMKSGYNQYKADIMIKLNHIFFIPLSLMI